MELIIMLFPNTQRTTTTSNSGVSCVVNELASGGARPTRIFGNYVGTTYYLHRELGKQISLKFVQQN